MAFDKQKLEIAAKMMLEGLGEDVEREGLIKTPHRVAKGMSELCSGYAMDHKAILATDFDGNGYDEMVILREVDFFSLCEHHVLPFYGTATLAYIPGKRVVGLSKLARLVDCFARRLQIQEKMTRQIGDALQECLSPRGWGVSIRAHHLCMKARGVAKPRGEMITTAVGGLIKEDPKAREEFLRVCS